SFVASWQLSRPRQSTMRKSPEAWSITLACYGKRSTKPRHEPCRRSLKPCCQSDCRTPFHEHNLVPLAESQNDAAKARTAGLRPYLPTWYTAGFRSETFGYNDYAFDSYRCSARSKVGVARASKPRPPFFLGSGKRASSNT